MRIDVILPAHLSADEMLALGRLADEQGLGTVWVANVLASRDPFVNFVPLAMQTRHVGVGPIAVSPFELHPLKMANLLLTLNEFAAGRGRIVVGAGGGTLQAMNLKPKRIVRAVREAVEILRLAASGQAGPYRGEVYDISWLDTSWVSAPAPTIYVGANLPQMLRMGAGVGDGIMVSDFTPERVRWARAITDPVLGAVGRNTATFPFNNFWAWHVAESAEEAEREARIFLAVRGTIYPDYIRDVVGETEAQIVTDNLGSFMTAYTHRSPDIDGVPDDVLRQIVAGGVSASPVSELDREIDRLLQFKSAGLTEIALCLYSDFATKIRLLGERVVPALA
jgi:5,10-methylenetetrahydromethanopterin reductase